MLSDEIIFVCAVASPRSMYRAMHKAYAPTQLVEWEKENLGEYPIFTPMMVARREIRHVADSKTDGLSHIWDGKELILPRGARVAVGPAFRFQSGISGLLEFSMDEKLEAGRCRVEPSSDDGFKFKVRLAADLYNHLRYQRNDLAGSNIMVHIVSAALVCLREKYSKDDGEEGWRSYPNLVGFADLLQQKGLPHWADSDDFKPEIIATGLYAHKLPSEN